MRITQGELLMCKLPGPLLPLLCVITLFFSTVDVARAHRPHDAIFTSAISPEFASDGEVICAIDYLSLYILKSTDGGFQFRPSQNGILDDKITALAYSPTYAADRTLFAGTNGGQVYRTADGGDTWQLVTGSLPGDSIMCIALSPDHAADGTVFVGTLNGGVYKSVDDGQTWSPVNGGLYDLRIYSLSISPDFSQDQTVFAGTFKGVFRSTDGGASWQFKGMTGWMIRALDISPEFAVDGEVMAGTFGDGIYKSVDGGDTWTPCGATMTDPNVMAVAFSPAYASDATVLAAGRDTGVFQSNDGGAAWTLYDDGLEWRTPQSDVHFYTLNISPDFANDGTVFAGMFEGMFRSTDGGKSWHEANTYPPHVARALCVSPDYVNDGKVFHTTYGAGIQRSADGGATWEIVNKGLPGRFVYAIDYPLPDYNALVSLSIAPADEHGRLLKSLDEGNNWFKSVVDPINTFKPAAHGFALSPNFLADRTVFLGNRADGDYPFYKSTNAGNNFRIIDPGFRTSTAIAVSPQFATDKIVYIASEVGVYKSSDGGETFTQSGLPAEIVTDIVVASDLTVFAGTRGSGVFKSTDGGATWIDINNGLTDLTIMALCLSPEYDSDRTVFVSSIGAGISRSVNGGASWQPSGLAGNYVMDLAISPAYGSDRTVFAGTWDGVYKSLDGGATWDLVTYLVRYEEGCMHLFGEGSWLDVQSKIVSSSTIVFTNVSGSRITVPFVGKSVSWIATRGPNHGIARVYVDGALHGTADLYAPNIKTMETVYTVDFPDVDYHEFTVNVTHTKNPSSTGYFITVDAFDVVLR
jgi:photosystem II stability/assembly factor-like uncharacterized protein